MDDRETFRIANRSITPKQERELIRWIRSQAWLVDQKTFLRSFVAKLEMKNLVEKLGWGDDHCVVKVTEYRPGQGGTHTTGMDTFILSVGSDVTMEINKEWVRLRRRSLLQFKLVSNEMRIAKTHVEEVDGFPRLRGVRYSIVLIN